MNLKLEYLWLDGYNPQQIRSKTKIIKSDSSNLSIDSIIEEYKSGELKAPTWNFDGSSTNQAETSNSELLLVPVNFFKNPFVKNSILVVSEVYNTDMTPHKSNTRNKMISVIDEHDDESMWGYEEEYFIFDNYTNRPLGWPADPKAFPRKQGEYYCSVGSNNVSGRDFVEEHVNLCLEAGLLVSGINAEVALGQWEYQIGPVYAKDGADQLWVSRYILHRLSERYNYRIELDPKPYKGLEWNGSGMHVNFSTKTLREDKKNKKKIAENMCKRLEKKHKEHIELYGVNNEHRLTGANETSSISKFGYGIGDRTKSIRIPSSINDPNAIGYFEDRRPSSNADPYLIVGRMIKTILKDKVLETN